MTQLQIGLVGCGRWGRNILRDLKALDCQVWVADPNAGVQCDDVEALVSKVDDLPTMLDAYVVATPTQTHAGVIQSLLSFQRPIFCEKPLTNDPVSARQIADMAPQQIFVMEKWRYHPGIQALRSIVESGELGQLTALHLKRLGWGYQHQDVDPVWTLLPHDLSIASAVLGSIPTPRAASAELHMGEVSGLFAQLEMDAVKVWIELSANRLAYERSVLLQFEHGSAAMQDPYADHVLVQKQLFAASNNLDAVERRSISREYPLMRELRAFVAYLQGGPVPFGSVAESANNVETISRLRHMAGLDRS